jgi:hypothetical protein
MQGNYNTQVKRSSDVAVFFARTGDAPLARMLNWL